MQGDEGLTLCLIDVVGNVSTTFTATDDAGNTASFTLVTVVVDVLPPTIAYTSRYRTLSATSNAVTETVNASSGAYALGTFMVREQPSNTIMAASVLQGSHRPNLCML